MAPSKLDICNMALGYIGTRTIQQTELTNAGTTPVSSPTSPEAIQCVLYWDRARREVLSDFPYAFAVRRAQLVAAASVPYVWSEWTNAYNYPSDAIKVLSVHHYIREERIPFVVEFGENTNDRYVLCNDDSAQCIYVKDVDAITAWDEKFVAAMALKLATLISTALLKNNPEKIKELVALYQASIPSERLKDGGWAVETENSKLNVFNAALGLVGARMVSAVSENCEEAVQCNLYWDRARKSVLRDFPYRFAVRRASLSARRMPTVYGGDWTNCYACPNDMLKVLSVYDNTDQNVRQPYEVEYINHEAGGNGVTELAAGPYILCNVVAAKAEVVYIADVPDPALWDEKFTAAMSAKLALFICGPLLAGEKDAGLNKAKELAELYKASIPQEAGWEPGGWAASGETERLNVCNIALGYLGVKMITHLSEDVPESVQCRLNWDRARRSVLRDYPFRFAVHRGALSSTTMPAAHGGSWTNAYAYPSDALRVISLHDGAESEERLPFAVEYTANGPILLCNKASGVQAVYIADVEDPSLWDEQFTTCMGLRLAMLISGALLPVDAHQAKMKELLELYQRSLPGERMKEENWAVDGDATRLNVCNVALGFVGANMISSMSENCPEAVQCNLHWDRVRRSLLRDYPCRFAFRREVLQNIQIPPFAFGQWKYCYVLPDDCLKPLSIFRSEDREARRAFVVEHADGRQVVLCNTEHAALLYVADVPEVEKWDEKFTRAMEIRLAMAVCPALCADEQDGGAKRMQMLAGLFASVDPPDPFEEGGWAVTDAPEKLNICNMALSLVGAKMITSIAENTPEAIQCNLFWDRARRGALRDFPYRFAQQRFPLRPVPVPPMYRRQWRFCYIAPPCLKVVRVHNGNDRVHRIPFAIELVRGIPHIFCNVFCAQATCTIDIEDPKRWDELFVTAMARKMAILIYPALAPEKESGRHGKH